MKKILVVDDSATVRLQVRSTLQDAGFEVVEATDGADATTKLDASISLALCDINMPRMNGLEMLEKVRSEPRFAALPIVMLTTEGQATMIERAKRAGAKGWIIKPFKTDLLVAAVRKLTA